MSADKSQGLNGATRIGMASHPAEPGLRELGQKRASVRDSGLADEDLDFVHDAKALLKRRRGRTLRMSMPWVSVLAAGGLLWWASWAEIDEVTRGQGKVIPSKSVQLIQSLEGGILEEIRVEEGQRVEAGQILLRIRDAIFASSYQENVARREMLQARLARLKAEGENLPALQFPEGTRSDIIATERSLFEARRSDRQATESALRSRLDLAVREEKLLEEGTKSRAISPVELIRVQKEVAELRGSLATLHSSFQRQAMEQFDKDNADLALLVEAIKKDKDRLDRTIIRSPVRGVVNKIHINTVGRVVGSGADIMTIVPSDDTLLIEANISPADIAFIRPGEKVNVKFTAYDSSRYGGLDGKVERIGVDTVTDEPGRQARQGQQAVSYYPITVRTERNSLGRDHSGNELAIIPGMVAEVDVLTGKKTVLEYLLMPLSRARERALRER